MDKRNPLALTGLERALEGDASGEVRDRLIAELDEYAFRVRRELFAGTNPAGYRDLERLRDALERARRLVAVAWKLYHPE